MDGALRGFSRRGGGGGGGGKSQVLCTTSGHKAAAIAMPRAGSLDFQVKPRNF
jgi:hypothetical protein